MPARDKYTDPDLRDQIKEEVHASNKGGRPGQWSARKAQLMASEYKKRGGSYTTDKETGQDPSQKHLSNWTDEEWQTKEGDANATKDDGTKKRYLPKKAWEGMSEEEKEETEAKKEEGGREGRQYVGNTGRAREERRRVSKDQDQDEDEEKEEGSKSQKKGGTSTAKKGEKSGGPSRTKKADQREKGEEDGEDDDGDYEEDGDHDEGKEEDSDFIEDAEANQAEEEEAEEVGDNNSKDEPHGQKRVHTRQDDKAENENKKQKTSKDKEDGEEE